MPQRIVWTLPQRGQGSALGAEYPDFRLLPSAQGLVFRPASDQLAIRTQPNQVELSAPGGLALSSDTGPRQGSDHAKP